MEDMRAGTVRMTDPSDFKVGENLAITPGAVVHRNRLMELIHYAPTRAEVRPVPIVLVTPWINKFYVLDLTPKKSMVKHLLDQGFDVYDDLSARESTTSDFAFSERTAGEVVANAREWIGRQQTPWFAWVHVFDPHAPYAPPPPFGARYAGDPYAGEVAYVDHALGPFLIVEQACRMLGVFIATRVALIRQTPIAWANFAFIVALSFIVGGLFGARKHALDAIGPADNRAGEFHSR